MILSHFQTPLLIAARDRGARKLCISLDLGLSETEVLLEPDHVRLSEKERFRWEHIHTIDSDENNCFIIILGAIEIIIAFSETFGRVHSLMPTVSAPALLISGNPMHKIKDTDPYRDTRTKIGSIHPLRGMVLDTATDLGYTPIDAACTSQRVITVELDPEVLQIARVNMWSQNLFENPKIESRLGDSAEVIQDFKSGSRDAVLHDPPTIASSGHLYEAESYQGIFRVLKQNGRLFHNIGNPESPSGRSTTSGVIKRLSEAGSCSIRRAPEAFGVVARRQYANP